MPNSASKRKPNWQILYNALAAGYEYQLDGLNLAVSEDGELCLTLAVYHDAVCLEGVIDGEPDEIKLVEYPIEFNQFIKDCESIPEEDIVGMVFYLGKDQQNRKEKKGRYRDDR